jgi:hypothetical protein
MASPWDFAGCFVIGSTVVRGDIWNHGKSAQLAEKEPGLCFLDIHSIANCSCRRVLDESMDIRPASSR